MDLIYLLILILLIMILFKLSSIQSRLEGIERVLKRKKNVSTDIKRVEKEKKSQQTEENRLSEVVVSIEKEKKKIVKEEIIFLKPKEKKVSKLKEYFDGVSIEELLFGNIILKIAIVAFILGIGLFLKYSIDKEWIPIWGRVLIGIMVGMAMLIGGIKMMNNRHKLFSEGLFGGGIAVLYLSVFAAFSLEEFKFIDVHYAFLAMIVITILAGIISVRFDAKSTAIFGLIGGFATPFLLSSESGNYVGLLSYMLMLNLGVLYISIYKKWSLLSWLAFMITSLTVLTVVWQTKNDFMVLMLLYGAFFIIYSIVPLINTANIITSDLKKSSLFLFWANFIVAILSFLSLFEHYDIKLIYYAGVTAVLAGYLLVYASVLAKKKLALKSLFYIVLAQSIALLLVTPAFIFEGTSLTIVWAVESLMLLWVAIKSNEKTYGLFALVGFVITIGRYLIFDMAQEYKVLVFYGSHESTFGYIQSLSMVSIFVIGSLFMGYKLLKKATLNFVYISQDLIVLSLFLLSFMGAYLLSTFIGLLLFNIYFFNGFSIVAMLLIALFSSLLYKSRYCESLKIIFTFFLALLGLAFIHNILSISTQNTMLSLVKFSIFMGNSIFIYLLVFKDSEKKISNYKLSNLLLSGAIGLLFIFLNVEVYHLVKLYDVSATKFAITLLWIVFGITLFVYGVLKNIKPSKLAGTVLIFIAIIKAFFIDLANLDSIYRIILFLILGAILFGLSYFYQSKNGSKNREEVL